MREDFHTSVERKGGIWPDGADFDPPPRPRRFPSELALRWTPVRSRPHETGPLHVLIEQSALRGIRRHLAQAGRGAAGLLTGDLNRCPESGQLWLSIEQASPGRGSVPDDAGAEVLDGIVSPLIREQALQGQRAIGWYHIHSALGVFLSPGEAEFHQLRFPELWQVAIVLLEDSERPAAGVFLRARDGSLSRSGYVAFYERLHRSSLLPEGRKRSFVGWSNHSTEEPVVIAGLDGVSEELSDLSELAAPAISAHPRAATPRSAVRDTEAPQDTGPGPGAAHFKGVTPVAAGPDGEAGPSEEAHDRAQMKRALSAVDFSITPLPEPLSTVAKDTAHGEESESETARPDPGGAAGPASLHSTGSRTRGGSSTSASATDEHPHTQEGIPAAPKPALIPPSGPIGGWQGRGSRHSKRARVNRIAWSAFGLLVVGTLMWLSFLGGRRSVSGEPIPDGAPPTQGDAPEPVAAAAASEPEPGRRATQSASLGEAPEVDLTPEIVPPPADVLIVEPFGNDLSVAPPGDRPPGSTAAETSEITEVDSASAALESSFLTALEIFDQERAGYGERRDAYEKGLVGCNALNSWYRSVGDAFVRLSSKVVEAGPQRVSTWRAGYEEAQKSMDEIDRHYLASECPLPR